jgi:hypothetical protein
VAVGLAPRDPLSVGQPVIEEKEMKLWAIRALSAAVITVTAAGAVGCGDSANESFVSQGNRLCREMNVELRHAFRPAEGPVHSVKLFDRVDREVRTARKGFYRAFLALDAPGREARALQVELRSVALLETALMARLDHGGLTTREAQQLSELPQTKRFVRAADRLKAHMRAYGLSCPGRMRW